MLLLTKAVFSIMIGFFISLICALLFIPILKRIKAEQSLSRYLQDTHKKKQGTPTMGGINYDCHVITILFTKNYLEL